VWEAFLFGALMELISVILGLTGQVLTFINEKQRTRYIDEYREILELKAKYENDEFPEYSDAKLDVLNERLCIFVEAVGGELGKEKMEKLH
jgi:hypothetical protein